MKTIFLITFSILVLASCTLQQDIVLESKTPPSPVVTMMTGSENQSTGSFTVDSFDNGVSPLPSAQQR